MLEEIKTFVAVVEHQNFTKAGKAINLSQPSVSLHIAHLEEYFDTTLIQRSNKQKKIIVTNTGILLYEKSKTLINLFEQTKLELSNYHNVVKGKLRIGASFTIGEYFLPAFLGSFSREYPDVDFEVTIENTTTICNMIKKLKLDVGLVEGTVPSDDFVNEHFYHDQMVLAVPTDSQLLNHDFKLSNIQNQTWITREEGSGTRDYFKMFLDSNNIQPKNILVFGSNYAVKEAVKNNLGITFISSYVAETGQKNGDVKIIDMKKEYNRYFSYICPKGHILSKAAEIFIDNLKKME